MLNAGLSMNREQIKKEMQKQQAIEQLGKSFINLKLLDFRKNRIQGAIVLHADEYQDSITGMTKFNFSERGGVLDFVMDDFKGGMFCRMLDCEHNRKFLASMFTTGYWEIIDEDVRKEIEEMANKISVVKPVKKIESVGFVVPPLGKEVVTTEARNTEARNTEARNTEARNTEARTTEFLTDADLEDKIRKLQEEKEKRESVKKEVEKLELQTVPKRGRKPKVQPELVTQEEIKT